MKQKLGRPTDNPKKDRLTVRLDEESIEILTTYCDQEKIDRAEGIRRGIKKLKSDIKTKK